MGRGKSAVKTWRGVLLVHFMDFHASTLGSVETEVGDEDGEE